MLVAQRVDTLAEKEENAVDVPFLQAVEAGQCTVAHAAGQQGEAQRDRLRE